jgi:hypothetical protein
MLKLNIHSIVDVITNSSTVIYTYQNSVKEAKELLQEILKLTGSQENVDNLFYFGVFLSDNDNYTENNFDDDELPADWPEDYKQQDVYIENLKESIMKSNQPKPVWMVKCEEYEGDFWKRSTSLHIIPKNNIHIELVKKMLSFLNSIDADGGRDD